MVGGGPGPARDGRRPGGDGARAPDGGGPGAECPGHLPVVAGWPVVGRMSDVAARAVSTCPDAEDGSRPDPRLATQVLRDLARAHAAAEQVAGLCEAAPEDLRTAIFGEFDAASRIVDAYPAALLWALAYLIEHQVGALPGSEREHEAVSARSIA